MINLEDRLNTSSKENLKEIILQLIDKNHITIENVMEIMYHIQQTNTNTIVNTKNTSNIDRNISNTNNATITCITGANNTCANNNTNINTSIDTTTDSNLIQSHEIDIQNNVEINHMSNSNTLNIMEVNHHENIINTYSNSNHSNDSNNIINNHNSSKKSRVNDKPFDISKYRQRHIALQIQYEGGSYYGFAAQAGECEDTIEKYLFDALLKLRLITDRKSCNYSRCGRTDRGVSAFQQVISLNIRSAFPKDIPEENLPIHPEDSYSIENKEKSIIEHDFTNLINKHLPDDIRVIAWTPVTNEFNARFSSIFRKYRYFFIKKELDIKQMNKAANIFIGKHDFRNFCKMDIANVSNFERNIYTSEIRLFKSSFIDSESIYVFEVQGNAFLWHMVRCMMSILLLIGQKQEDISIIYELLNIEKNPARPYYDFADELPLVLHECGYNHLNFQHQPKNLWMLTLHYENLLQKYLISVSRIKNCLDSLHHMTVRDRDVDKFINDCRKYHKRIKSPKEPSSISSFLQEKNHLEDCHDSKRHKMDMNNIDWKDVLHYCKAINLYPSPVSELAIYKPLLERPKCASYEERRETVGGNRKTKLQKHLELRSTERDNQFFQIMRNQGSTK